MIQLWTIIGLFHLTLSVRSSPPPLDRIRSLYYHAVDSEDSCQCLIHLLDTYQPKIDPLLTGYKAAGYMVMANHLFNPVKKLSFFKRGRVLLENAVAADTSDIELRLIRYSIQTHCPSFLGYKRNIQEDRGILLQYIQMSPNNSLRTLIVHYMRLTERLPSQG
jgi:hypothetical protein